MLLPVRSEPFGFAQDRLRRGSDEVEECDSGRFIGLRLPLRQAQGTLRPNGERTNCRWGSVRVLCGL